MLNSLRHPPSTERRLKKKPKNNSDSETTVRRRCISTWSSSATSTAENPPPPVSRPSVPSLFPHILIIIGHLIYKCGGIDKRTIEKFEKVCPHFYSILDCLFNHCPPLLSIIFWWGRGTKILPGCETRCHQNDRRRFLRFSHATIATTPTILASYIYSLIYNLSTI
jgi:hypothetical protein